MLNDTYAVTVLNVLNVDMYHKIRATSVGRASVFIKLQVTGSDLSGSFLLFFSSSSSFFYYCHSKLLQSGLKSVHY